MNETGGTSDSEEEEDSELTPFERHARRMTNLSQDGGVKKRVFARIKTWKCRPCCMYSFS